MNKWIPAIILLPLGLVGFAIAAKKTSKTPSATVGGTHYRAAVYQGDGGYYAQVFINDLPKGATLGPVPTEDGAAKLASDFLAAMDVPAFYTLRTSNEAGAANPDWYFDGWSRGVLVKSDGPFANENAAKSAALIWTDAALKLPFDGGAS